MKQVIRYSSNSNTLATWNTENNNFSVCSSSRSDQGLNLAPSAQVWFQPANVNGLEEKIPTGTEHFFLSSKGENTRHKALEEGNSYRHNPLNVYCFNFKIRTINIHIAGQLNFLFWLFPQQANRVKISINPKFEFPI